MPWPAPKAYAPAPPSDPAQHVAARGRAICVSGNAVRCSAAVLTQPEIDEPAITAMDTGGAHVCVVFDGGKLVCGGDNSSQQLGPPSGTSGIYGFDGTP